MKKFQKGASAQVPIHKQLGKDSWIATPNIKGGGILEDKAGIKKQGMREEVERWMKKNKIRIACIQETRADENSREARKGYTWFFSGKS